MPRILDAIRSGWNGSIASSFSPSAANLIGVFVTARIDSAARLAYHRLVLSERHLLNQAVR